MRDVAIFHRGLTSALSGATQHRGGKDVERQCPGVQCYAHSLLLDGILCSSHRSGLRLLGLFLRLSHSGVNLSFVLLEQWT